MKNQSANFKSKTLIIAMSAILSTQAFADQLPQPVPGPIKTLRFSDVLPVFEAGTPTSEQILTGTWVNTAVATNQECAEKNEDMTDASGIKNSDDSVVSLKFERVKIPANEILGQPESSVFSVSLLNLGSEDSDQGPFVVHSKMPQFAQYSYKVVETYPGYGSVYALNENVGFAYSCKRIKDRDDLMVCGKKLFGELHGFNDIACSATNPGILTVYKKLK